MDYDITYIDDGVIAYIFPPVFKSFVGDLEEVHRGEKYTIFFENLYKNTYSDF